MNTALLLTLLSAAVYLVRKFVDYRNVLQSIHHHPGLRTLLNPNEIASNLVPHIPYIAMGKNWHMKKYKYYEERGGVDIISSVSFFPKVEYSFTISDPAVIKEIVGARAKFPKPLGVYGLLAFFGRNIVVSEDDEWKKFRKISAPAFTEPNNKLVCRETVKIMDDLFEGVWGSKEVVEVDHALDITMPLALFVIGAAGFGRHISWNDENTPPPGHKLSFKETLYTVSTYVIVQALVPPWAMGLTKVARKTRLAFEELESYMLEMIEVRRSAQMKEETYDLLSLLVDASDESFGSDQKLTVREVLGNIFIFLIAGHETTAHTLCFAMALLALYPDEQERLYQEIKQVLPDGRAPTYDGLNSLTFADAIIKEALRMFPPAVTVPKTSAEDTVFTTTNANGDKVSVAVPRGSRLSLHFPGLHNNPKYWKDPEQFNPSRFLGDWNRDAFLPFSGGARSCIGRRFAEVESIVALTMVVAKYKITVKEEPQFASETFQQRRDRVLAHKPVLTLTPVRVPLVFTKRH